MEFEIIFEGEIILPANFFPTILPEQRIQPLFGPKGPQGYKVVIEIKGPEEEVLRFTGVGLSRDEAIQNATSFALSALRSN